MRRIDFTVVLKGGLKLFCRLFCFVILLNIFVSCSDEREDVGFPEVTTSEKVIVPEEGGAIVRFSIDYIGKNEIMDCGVVLNRDYASAGAYTVSLGSNPQGKIFSVSINSGLLSGVKYSVKAFVTTSERTIYGNEVDFISTGVKTPEIYSIEPIVADLGDTLVIKGNNFSNDLDHTVVSFNDVDVVPLSLNDTLAKVLVPRMNVSSGIELSLTTYLKKGTYDEAFNFSLPEISGIDPLIAFPGDSVMIFGQHLASVQAVDIGGEWVYGIVARTDSSISVALRTDVAEGDKTITLRQIDRDVETGRTLRVAMPKIESVSPQVVWIDSVLTVRGTDLDKIEYFFFGGMDYRRLPVEAVSDTIVKLKVEDAFTEGILYGQMHGRYVMSDSRITLSPPVITTVTPATARYGEVVTLTGDRFFNGLSSPLGELSYVSKNEMKLVVGWNLPAGQHPITFNEFGSSSFPASVGMLTIPEVAITGFSQDEIMRGQRITMSVVNLPLSFSSWYNPWVSIGGQSVRINVTNAPDKIELEIPMDYLGDYPAVTLGVGAQTTTIANVLHVIEPWSKPQTTNELSFPIFVSTGDKTYALVHEYTSGTLYFFNPQSGKWEFESQLTTSPFICDNGVRIGDDLYFYGSWSEGELGSVYKYSTINKRWMRLTDFPLTLYAVNEFAFDLNSQLYLGTGAGLYAYDEIGEQWVEKSPLPMVSDFMSFPCNFSIGGKGYIAPHSRISSDNTPNVLWEYNPDSDSWTNLYASFSHILMKSSGVVYGGKAYLVAETNENSSAVRIFEFDPGNKQIKEFLGPPVNYLSHVFVEGEYLYGVGVSPSTFTKIPLEEISGYFKQ